MQLALEEYADIIYIAIDMSIYIFHVYKWDFHSG